MMDVKDMIADSNLAAISDVEAISASAVTRWPVVIKTEFTTYVKDCHEHGRNYVVNLCLIIGGLETSWAARAQWGRSHL